jgi:hypothetical protein
VGRRLNIRVSFAIVFLAVAFVNLTRVQNSTLGRDAPPTGSDEAQRETKVPHNLANLSLEEKGKLDSQSEAFKVATLARNVNIDIQSSTSMFGQIRVQWQDICHPCSLGHSKGSSRASFDRLSCIMLDIVTEWTKLSRNSL